MLTLNVRVEETRDRTGVATLRDGLKTLMTGPVVASATQAIAARRGNPGCDPLRVWGHPPFGGYRLLHYIEARRDLHGEYGTHLLLFEPESGQALEAESFGRLALLAYGGPAGRDGRLRRTQGGLRLSSEMLHAIVGRLRAGADMALVLAPLTAPAWWQFWKRPEETMPLSGTAPEFLSPPADEASVVEELLMNPGLVRRRRTPGRDDSRDWDDDDRRDRSSSGRDSGSGRESVQGRGGESAGAGASGGWDSAPGRNPGVDQAGRIVAGAAAAAGLAAIASEAAGAGSRGDGAGAGDTGAGSGSDGSAGTSSDTGTTTSTAY